MNKEELDNIQQLIERKITLAEVTGGLTSSDKKFIALWNYTIELQNQVEKLTQENNDFEERVIHQDNVIKQLKEKINTYENPDDLTLMFMYCDEKAKDKIKHLESIIDKAIEKIQLLIDIGFDYDGYRQADGLMTLIDELVSYAKESRDILRSKE